MKISAFQFALDIEAQIEATLSDDYRLRVGRIGTLVEELYPLSRFALSLKQPGLRVEIEVFEKLGRVDAHVELSGFLERQFPVEVTYAGYGYEEALRDELMVKNGFAPGAGPIIRERGTREIKAEITAEDIDAPLARLAQSIHDRLHAKNSKTYPAETVLLIAFENFHIRGRGWSKLYTHLDLVGKLDHGNFQQVFLFNRFSNELQQAA
jgi:hypothetical protein